MNRREMMSQSGCAALALGLSRLPLGWAQPPGTPKRNLLFFSKSSGHEHSAIKRPPNQLSHAEQVLIDLGGKNGFSVTVTKDGGLLSAEWAKYDVFVFYTTGDLTKEGTDLNPPITAAGKAALLDAIKNGKGFVGVHSATDTFHTPGDRYQAFGEQADPYIKMIGAEFIRHGPQQKSKMIAVDRKFPGCEGLKEEFELHEEWYSFKDFAKDLHVLLVQETKGMQGNVYQRGPYPATWVRRHGRGRVFYTSLGHREDVWTNPIFQAILLGGLAWAAGKVEADVTPNLDKVAPRYHEMPPRG